MLPTTLLDPTLPVNPMTDLDRVLQVVTPMALANPAHDAVVLARTTGSFDPCQVSLNSIDTATLLLAGAKRVQLDPVLATARFDPSSPLPQPTAASDTAWASYSCIAGPMPGQRSATSSSAPPPSCR